jgi:chlorite dismutase
MIIEFSGGDAGAWRIDRIDAVVGPSLPFAPRLAVVEGRQQAIPVAAAAWTLRAAISNVRYAHADELAAMRARQEGLGRPQATRAALIPISKSEKWWSMAQDERRAIFEETSHHIGIGLDYLPGVARRLHHGRDLGEPFDFLTWFEYAPEHAEAFETMCRRLRETEEWRYVTREIDVRLSRAD